MTWSPVILCTTTLHAIVNDRLMCRVNGMPSGTSSIAITNKNLGSDVLGPSRLTTKPWLRLCLHSPINATTTKADTILRQSHAAAALMAMKDGGISAAIVYEIAQTVNGLRLGSQRYT